MNEQELIIAGTKELITAQKKNRKDYDVEYENELETVKANLEELIRHSKAISFEIIGLIRDSESPRLVETLPSLLKVLSEINKDYLTVAEKKRLQKQLQDTDEEIKPAAGNYQQNNIFVGSTEDLIKMFSSKGE